MKIAADAIVSAVNGQNYSLTEVSDPELTAKQGCFVTIKNNGILRGCIGQFIADEPLINMVADMAVSAAVRDPRFITSPITNGELAELDIEISVLSPLQKTDDPLSLNLGKDGIYIVKGTASGCFLPQVATETGWSKEQFLSYCCKDKAGLDLNAWKDDDTDVYLFTCDVFGKKLSDI